MTTGGFLRHDRGGSAVEFALIAPLLAVLLLGMFDVGFAFHSGAAVRNAVQRESRALMVNSSTSAATLRTSVINRLPNVPVDSLTMEIAPETMTGGIPARKVSWRYSVPVRVPFLPAQNYVFDNSIVVPVAP